VVLDVMRMPLIKGFLSTGNEIPFVMPLIPKGLGTITAVLAVVLGFWQSYGETRHGTFPLLLNLPIARRRLFALKIAVGLGLTWGLAGIALAVLCIWAATPGTHASPFDWSMTVFSWCVWFAMPLLYLAGFTMGIYPARWLGNRVFPLLTAGFVLLCLFVASDNQMLPATVFVLLVLLADVVFIAAIDYIIRTRDFS